MKLTGKVSASSSILKGLGKLAIGTGKVALAVLELSQAGQRAHEKREKARRAKFSSSSSHSSFDNFIERNGDRPLSECQDELRNQMEQVRQDSYQEGGEALRKGVLREVE